MVEVWKQRVYIKVNKTIFPVNINRPVILSIVGSPPLLGE